MGLYVSVRLHTGEIVGEMEILREEPLEAREDPQGVFVYRYRLAGKKWGLVEGRVEHERRNDVWELVRACLNDKEHHADQRVRRGAD